jgi:ribosome biogenesis GTPase
VADSPGFSVLDLPEDVSRARLVSLFREFGAWTDDCRFGDCQHAGEKECGIKDAVKEGSIAQTRHENYLALLQEVKERERSY